MKSFQYRLLFLLISFSGLISSCSQGSRVEIENLTCEAMKNPNGIAKDRPRLGWQLVSGEYGVMQTAYQIIVASDEDKIKGDEADIWDSGKVNSSQSQWVLYGGVPLKKRKNHFWKIRVWDQEDKISEWSEVNNWTTVPGENYFDAEWIGAIRRENSNLPQGRHYHSPVVGKEKRDSIVAAADSLSYRSIMLRQEFPIEGGVKNAKVYISGLGHYELTLNGKKIGNSEFAPLWTDYDKTVYYNIYDLTAAIKKGSNAIGVLLGNGMYNVIGERYSKFFVSFGPPTLFFKMIIEYKDGSEEVVSSDGSWKYSESPITYNSIFGGEDYDATMEQDGWKIPGFSDKAWKRVVVQNAPKGKLKAQEANPIRVKKQFKIQKITRPKAGIYVLDMGQNLSGFPSIKIKGKKGQTIKLVVGEYLKDDGTVGQERSGAPYYYEYTLKGEGIEEWRPRFSYYGFQYIQVDGANVKGFDNNYSNNNLPLLLDVKSNFIYNDVETTGNFECSNEIFNKAHQLINNSIKSNMQSVFTDCPHREKLGWLEETHLNGPGLIYNYNLQQFIPKLMQDISDAQGENGLIPSIAPEYVVFSGDFRDSPEWGVAGVVLPWMYYNFYGDPSLIKQYYGVMKRYVDYLTTKSQGYIVSHGLGDWYDYGERPAGYSQNTPIALSATSHYYLGAKLVTNAAKLLGRTEDISKYGLLTKKIRNAFNKKFFNKETKQYGTGSQFSNSVPVFMDIVEKKYRSQVLDNLLSDIKKHGYRLTTGDVGNRYLYQTLARNGYNDVMYKMQNHYDAPGYGFQIKFGLTTLTEQWDPRKGNSWNHFMMGQIEEWFYRSLAGIAPDMGGPGFKEFNLQPKITKDLTYVKASYNSNYGLISSNWNLKGKMLHYSFSIPPNTVAKIRLPNTYSHDIRINNQDIENSDYILDNSEESGSLVFKLGSGKYVIEALSQ